MIKFTDDDADCTGICSDCNGSGEGMWEGQICRTCRGTGGSSTQQDAIDSFEDDRGGRRDRNEN